MKKVKIAIDIDEVLRAKWIQFDRYYVEEFGEEGVPDEEDGHPYTQDFFNKYKWKDIKETIKYLKDPEKTPETINPLDYQVDENNEANADVALFKPAETEELTAEEVYNRFMYQDYVLELHGTAPVMYKGMEVDFDKFFKKFKDRVEFVIISKENVFTIPPTLFFLSKMMCRFSDYRFVKSFNDYWFDDIDIIITTNPEVISCKPKNKKHIKPKRPYNIETNSGEFEDILQIKDLTDNIKFENLLEKIEKEEIIL